MWTITKTVLTEEETKYWWDTSKLTLGDQVCNLDFEAIKKFANKCTNFVVSNGKDKFLVMFRNTSDGCRMHEVIFEPYMYEMVPEPLAEVVNNYSKPIMCIIECPRHETMKQMLKYVQFNVEHHSDKEFVICQA